MSLFEARKGEGAWDKVPGCWVGGWWWLVWVEGAAVVFWGAEAVSIAILVLIEMGWL